jgi:TolA-binding protein
MSKDPSKLATGQGTPLEARAGRLLETADTPEPWGAEDREESWLRIADRVDEPRRPIGFWLALAGPAVLVAGLLVVALFAWTDARRENLLAGSVDRLAAIPAKTPAPVGPRTIDLGSIGTIEVTEATVYQLLPASALRLEAGRLCAVVKHRDPLREGPFTVLAPKLRIVDVGTRFCVEVAAGRTTVAVSEGAIRAEGEGGRSVEVVAGHQIASDDARLRPPVPSVAATAPSTGSCESLPTLSARESCEAAASSGDGLAAQNALYNLALLARDQRHDGASALTLFQAYRHRFPEGPLAPEASLGILTELSQEGRYADAASEASQYLKAYPGEAKAAQVGLVLGNLERERLENPAAARSAYEQVVRSAAEPEVAGEALFGLALSELQLGQKPEAQATARRYLAEHPTGARAVEAKRLLER